MNLKFSISFFLFVGASQVVFAQKKQDMKFIKLPSQGLQGQLLQSNADAYPSWTQNISIIKGVQLKSGIDSSIVGTSTSTRIWGIQSNNSKTGSVLTGLFETQQSEATTGGPQGVEGYVYTSNSSGTVVLSIATIGNVEHAGIGTLSNGRMLQGSGILSGAGNIESLCGVFTTYAISGTGIINDYYGAYLEAPKASRGSIVQRWGLYSTDVDAKNYFAGTLGVGTNSPSQSAKLEVSSISQGFLPPRMTGLQAEAINLPAEGLLIYAVEGNGITINSKGWWGYDGKTWTKLN